LLGALKALVFETFLQNFVVASSAWIAVVSSLSPVSGIIAGCVARERVGTTWCRARFEPRHCDHDGMSCVVVPEMDRPCVLRDVLAQRQQSSGEDVCRIACVVVSSKSSLQATLPSGFCVYSLMPHLSIIAGLEPFTGENCSAEAVSSFFAAVRTLPAPLLALTWKTSCLLIAQSSISNCSARLAERDAIVGMCWQLAACCW